MNSLGYYHNDYRDALRAVIAAEGTVAVDLHAMYGTAPASYIGGDGVHPTVEGHQVVADAVQSALSSLV